MAQLETLHAGGMAEALTAATDAYLGDLGVVETLVRSYIAEVTEAESPDAIVRKADAMALIFAGVGDYKPVPEWNVRSQLGLYVASRYGKVDPNASLVEILKSLFLDAAQRTLEAVTAVHTKGEEAGRFLIDSLIEELVAVLTGTWEIVFPPDEVE
jgi:hypothetical protein